jgi:hypothetical protein
MRTNAPTLGFAVVCALSVALAQCSGSGGTGKTLPKGTSAPGTASPTPSASPGGTPSPSPSPTGVGNTSCTAPVVTAGIFTSIETTGVASGSTYTDDGDGSWEAIQYSPASATPAPTPSASPGPSATPTPSAAPSPTGTPVMVTEYFGEYTVTAYSGNIEGGGNYSAAATNGCFFLLLEQPVGGTIGQSRKRPNPAAAPNAFGDGEPNEPGTEAETFLDEGSITSLTITNLTPTTGTGSFAFTNSADSTATGTITITGSQTFSSVPDVRRGLGLLRKGPRTR